MERSKRGEGKSVCNGLSNDRDSGADHIMNAVVLLAIISSMNSGLYGSSRVLYTQAVDGRVPKIFSRLSKKKVPVPAILMCTSALYGGVLISLFAGSKTFDFLMGSLGYTVLFIWLIIAFAHLKSRKQQSENKCLFGKMVPVYDLGCDHRFNNDPDRNHFHDIHSRYDHYTLHLHLHFFNVCMEKTP